MQDERKVSIIIPTFNRSSLVRKAIDSALLQSYQCEVIVVDHGSTDDTPKIMKEYNDKIKYIRRDDDFGPVYCWLDGILHASGEFIHIQYDDDLIEKNYIERCMEFMNEDVGIVFTDAIPIDLITEEKGKILSHISTVSETGIYECSLLEKELIFSGHKLISPGACLLRKEDAIDALYQGKLPINNKELYHGVGADLFISLLVMLRYDKFAYIKEPLAIFGVHKDSITMDAYADKNKLELLKNAYNEVRVYYLNQKDLNNNYNKYWNQIKKSNFIICKKIIRRLKRYINRLRKK